MPVYIVPGGWDWTKDTDKDAWKFLKDDYYHKKLIVCLNNLVDVHHKIINVGDYKIIGYGIPSGPEYPQYKEGLDRFKPNQFDKAVSNRSEYIWI
ncbi:MAG: hypothetical protein K0B02_01990 [DPANN group archaeon]|nr:hypothetical protein [DPANN group archaeon]